MKASDLIRKLACAISEFGDLDVLVRDCSNGYDYDSVSVTGDPASEAEDNLGIHGTIDLNVWCASQTEPYIQFGCKYLFKSCDSDKCDDLPEECVVMRMLTPSECDAFDVGNMYRILLSSGEVTDAFEDELTKIE